MAAAIYREREALVKEKEFLEQKLNIHLDFWAADKWQLENLLLMAERAHNCKAVFQAYENAQLDLSLGSQQEELLLTNLRLESALDDARNLQSRMDILGSQLQGEKGNVELLRKQALIQEAHMFEEEAEFASKLHEASEKQSQAEKKFQDVQQELTEFHSNYKTEMDKEKTEAELCKSKLSKELAALLRERDFVWNQLKRMEADYCSQLKVREEQIQQAAAEIKKLRDSIDLMQRITDERAVELTILKMELKKAEDASRNKLLAEGAKNSQLNGDPEGHLDQLQSQNLQAKEVQAFAFLEQDSTNQMVAAAETSDKEDELRKALKRLDEVRLENENLRVLYAELEARYNEQQKPDKSARNGRKDTTTRNLNSELEAVAEGAIKLKRSLSRKARSEKSQVTKANGASRPVAKRTGCETSGKRRQGKRKLPSDSTGNLSRKAKAMIALNERNSCSTLVEQGSSLVKTSFFSSAFSIPKVKGLASLR